MNGFEVIRELWGENKPEMSGESTYIGEKRKVGGENKPEKLNNFNIICCRGIQEPYVVARKKKAQNRYYMEEEYVVAK